MEERAFKYNKKKNPDLLDKLLEEREKVKIKIAIKENNEDFLNTEELNDKLKTLNDEIGNICGSYCFSLQKKP